tara:strand:+ start:184 stop:1464 length:1281 start_codon:yes stop_codon:yes gene_type:complete
MPIIIEGSIAMAPSEYNSYLYQWTQKSNNMKYVGYHTGSVLDDYNHSSTNKEFNLAFANPNEEFTIDILAYGSKIEMQQQENILLSKVDAKNNPEWYNKTNGIQRYTDIDLDKCKDLVKDIRDGKFRTRKESVASQVAMKGYQVRFQHSDKHQKDIKESIDLAKGDASNCFGKGQGVRALVFEGRAEGGQDLRVDGNHSVYAADQSKHCFEIDVTRIPYWINKEIVEAELNTFCNLLNPRSKVRRKETDESTGIKFLLDNYKKSSIPVESESNFQVLKAIGFTGSWYRGAIKRIKDKANNIITKDEKRKTGQVWINYLASPHNKTIEKAIQKYENKDGWCSIKCSSAYFRYDRALEEIYDANEVAKLTGEPEIKNCKMWIYHANKVEQDKWEEKMYPKWKQIAKLTTTQDINIEISVMPTTVDDIH